MCIVGCIAKESICLIIFTRLPILQHIAKIWTRFLIISRQKKCPFLPDRTSLTVLFCETVGYPIGFVSVKYLGVLVNNKLRFVEHTRKIL